MSRQKMFDFDCSLPKHFYDVGERSSGETHGVVLTKPHVVELILDLVGYSARRKLARVRLLEPACGEGAFVVAAVRRLLASLSRSRLTLDELQSCIRAFDINSEFVGITRRRVVEVLAEFGAARDLAENLAQSWVREDDFLLAQNLGQFDAVVGNPPYVRIEQLTPKLQRIYRATFATLFDRADLYVAFIERGLSVLATGGVLSFICADRWTMNRYGTPLRQLIAERYAVRAYVDLHQASPFESEVVAYPSIFAIANGPKQRVLFSKLETASPEECAAVSHAYSGKKAGEWLPSWYEGSEPWVLTSAEHIAVLRDLEQRFPTLEGDGKTKVGIGVATGCDEVFIVSERHGIESDCLVPLVMRDDVAHGEIRWGGRFVVNTFLGDGSPVPLESRPGLRRYLLAHEDKVRGRHVSRVRPAFWYRTIDRVYPDLVQKPKLLIPDIAGSNEVVFDRGNYHPHHNFYFVISDSWDLEVLGGLLSSKVALFFVWCYAVKMRGGYMRFQAQYLRRIRVPRPESLSKELQAKIKFAFQSRDFSELDALALQAYSLAALPPFSFVETRR